MYEEFENKKIKSPILEQGFKLRIFKIPTHDIKGDEIKSRQGSYNFLTLKRLTFVLHAVVFWKTTQVDIISQCTTQAGPIPCGKMAANRLKAITLAVIELKCHKNWKRPPFQCKFFFSGNVYLKLLWYTTKDQATEHKLDTIEITRIHFLMGKFVSKSVSKCVEFTTSGSLIRM